MTKSFNGLNKILRIVLLIIPFVNWIIELVIRWETYGKKKSLGYLIFAIIITVGIGIVWGWIDAIAIAVSNKMVFAE